MTTLTIAANTDFSGIVLDAIDEILFTNATSGATAIFSSAQFDDLQISDAVTIVGSDEHNSIIVDVAPGARFSVDLWTFSNWGADDTIIINGTSGIDSIDGSIKNDIIDGGDGNDFLLGGLGDDMLEGGDGDDQIIGSIDPFGSGSSSDDGNNIMIGGAGNDYLYGGDGEDTMSGGDGNDFLEDHSGGSNSDCRVDALRGGAGDDFIRSYGGGDLIIGGSGIDSVELYGIDTSLDLTVDISKGGLGADIGDGIRLSSIESIMFFSGTGNDVLIGGDRDDELYSGYGNDTLKGGTGNDKLVGGDGNNTLSGGHGADYLAGGSDYDILKGGKGSDTFAFVPNKYSHRGVHDLITDFKHGVDEIDVSGFIYDSVLGTLQFIGQADFSDGVNEVRFEYTTGGDTLILINFGTVEKVEFGIRLRGISELTADDFIL